MKITMYGTKNRPDVRAALEEAAQKKIELDFRNFDEDITALKEFIRLRDASPKFDGVKKDGGIGIPCFLDAAGEPVFKLDEAAKD